VTSHRRTVVYGADGANSGSLEAHAAKTDLLILEATFGDDSQAAAKSLHMTATQAGELARRVGARRLLLTHLLPGSGPAYVELAARSFDGDIELAREGLSYEL
jgi:ribonuclease BN (tRNA processing enzyme)